MARLQLGTDSVLWGLECKIISLRMVPDNLTERYKDGTLSL
jgi:hypothetical protein